MTPLKPGAVSQPPQPPLLVRVFLPSHLRLSAINLFHQASLTLIKVINNLVSLHRRQIHHQPPLTASMAPPRNRTRSLTIVDPSTALLRLLLPTLLLPRPATLHLQQAHKIVLLMQSMADLLRPLQELCHILLPFQPSTPHLPTNLDKLLPPMILDHLQARPVSLLLMPPLPRVLLPSTPGPLPRLLGLTVI